MAKKKKSSTAIAVIAACVGLAFAWTCGSVVAHYVDSEYFSVQGEKGADGVTPTIGENGNWVIGKDDTGIKAQGETPYVGENGNWWVGTEDTGVKAQGDTMPAEAYVGQDGNWWIGNVNTGVRANENETPETSSDTYVGTNGNWWITIGQKDTVENGETDDIDTGITAISQGIDANRPHIGDNGNWFVGDEDTGVPARGPRGYYVQSIETVAMEEGDTYYGVADWTKVKVTYNDPAKEPDYFYIHTSKGIASIQYASSNGLVDTYTITYTDGTSASIQVTNGKGISTIAKTSSSGLVDTYTITYNDGTTSTYNVKNGRGIKSIEEDPNGIVDGDPHYGDDDQALWHKFIITYDDGDGVTPDSTEEFFIKDGKAIASVTSVTSQDGLSVTYTITYNDGSTPTVFTVTSGRGIVSITKNSHEANETAAESLVDTYTITYTSGSPSTFTVVNGAGIASIAKTSGNGAAGTQDEYTITYTDGRTPTTFNVTHGSNGSNVLTGSGAPSDADDGVDGDSYIDLDTWDFYTKSSGTWSTAYNIRGASVLYGTVDPTTQGKDGDSYLNTATWDFFTKENGSWVKKGNLHYSGIEYTVTYNTAGGSTAPNAETVNDGHHATKPADPTKSGYYFQGWYTPSGTRWDFDKDVVASSITLTARWGEFVVDNNGVLTGVQGATGNLIIPAEVDGVEITALDDELFKNITTLTSVYLPNTLQTIGDSAFEGCTGLKYLHIPYGVTTIGDSALKGCTGLTSIVVPQSVTSIGSEAFNVGSTAALEELTVPFLGLAANGTGALIGVASDSATPNATNPGAISANPIHLTVTGQAGVNVQIKDNALAGITNIETVTLGSSIKVIGASAFKKCYGLRAVDVRARTLTSLGASAFEDCGRLKDIHIAQLSSGILESATFKGCHSLENFEFPKGVTQIGNNAFLWCEQLRSVTLPASLDTPANVGSNVFSLCQSLKTFYVYNSTYQYWTTAKNGVKFSEKVPSNVNVIVLGSDSRAQ